MVLLSFGNDAVELKRISARAAGATVTELGAEAFAKGTAFGVDAHEVKREARSGWGFRPGLEAWRVLSIIARRAPLLRAGCSPAEPACVF